MRSMKNVVTFRLRVLAKDRILFMVELGLTQASNTRGLRKGLSSGAQAVSLCLLASLSCLVIRRN